MIKNAMIDAENDKNARKQEAVIDEFDNGTAVLQFKVQLKHTGSPVWRRVLIPDNWSFAGLHAVIQSAFEWQDNFPHNFVFGGKVRIESEKELEIMSDTNPDVELRSEDMTEIADVYAVYEHGIYTYDFNENWEHDVIFERVLPREPSVVYPCCTKARGAAPSDDNFEPIEPDIDQINIRLALLVPRSRLFRYMNPYEWRLGSCLNRQKLLSLRTIGRFHKTRIWSKLKKESLIDSLKKDIPVSIDDFVRLPDSDTVSDLQLMAYLLAVHNAELPFEPELYQTCFHADHDLYKIIEELKNRGYVFELSELDSKQLPAAIRKNPEVFYPVLVMPLEIKKEILKRINEQETERIYIKRVCIE